MKTLEYLSLLSDTTFKYLFKSDIGRKYLNKVIQITSNINIENFILIDNELNSGNKYRDYRTDIILYNKESNIIVNVEMNQYKNDLYIYRNYSYISKIVGALFDKGEEINRYKVVQVNFNNFYNEYNNDISGLVFMLRDKEYDIERDMIKVIEVYIPTYKGVCYNEKNEEEMYLSMFNAKSFEELKSIVKDNKEGLSIMDELEYLAAQEDVIGLYNYEREQKRMMATLKNEGYDEGLAEGENRALEIIKMIKKGKTNKEIEKETSASLDFITSIRENM